MEWLSLAFPVLGIVVLSFILDHKKWLLELLIPVGVVILTTIILDCLIESSLTHDEERLGYWVTTARYYEPWDEWVHQICYRTVRTGKNTSITVPYDCSHRVYHPARYELVTNKGEEFSISEGEYLHILGVFQNQEFIELNRPYYTIDGNLFETHWDGSEKRLQPYTKIHSFENRVKASSSLFSYIKVENVKRLGLYPYPKLQNHLEDTSLLGVYNYEADIKLQKMNARLGESKQVRIWVIVFHEKPREQGNLQEAYWVGGKKNEVVITLSIDKEGNIQWCYPFCWNPNGNTSNTEMKAEIRDTLTGKKLDLVNQLDFIQDRVKEKFKRKSFKEFEYLSVEKPFIAVVLLMIFNLAVTIFIQLYLYHLEKEQLSHRR